MNLYSAFIVEPHTQDAQVRITQCYLLITPYLRLPRKHSPDGASPDWVCGRLIAAYYSFIYPRNDERLSRPGWLTYSGRFTHISGHPSSASRSQDRESSPVKDRRATTVLRNQLIVPGSRLMGLIELGVQVSASLKKTCQPRGSVRVRASPHGSVRSQGDWLCVCVIKRRTFLRCEWISMGSIYAVTSRSTCLVQIRCGPMCSDAVRCGNLSYPMPQHPFLSVARRNTSRGCGIQRRPTEQYLPPAQHQRIAKIVLFSEVFVRGCVGVNTITFEPFEISSRHFYGSNVWPKARMSSKMAAFRYTAARGTRRGLQQHGDYYTGRWWVGCYIWYSE